MNKILIDINEINFTNTKSNKWWLNTDYIEKILTILNKNNFLSLFTYLNVKDIFHEITSIEDVLNHVALMSTHDTYSFSLEKDQKSEKSFIDFSMRRSLAIKVCVSENDLTPQIYKDMNAAVLEIYRELKEVALFGPSINIWDFDTSFQRICPPRRYFYLTDSTVVDYISHSYFSNNPRCIHPNHDALYDKPLPEGATREIINDDLHVITWCDDPFNKEKWNQALMDREEWFYKNLDLEIDSNFNEHGHEKMTHCALENSFFDRYHSSDYIAYKKVSLNEEGEIDSSILVEIENFKKRGTLENGDPLKYIILVLPTMEEAIMIDKKSDQLNIHSTAYKVKRKYWMIKPIGNWRPLP